MFPGGEIMFTTNVPKLKVFLLIKLIKQDHNENKTFVKEVVLDGSTVTAVCNGKFFRFPYIINCKNIFTNMLYTKEDRQNKKIIDKISYEKEIVLQKFYIQNEITTNYHMKKKIILQKF